MMYSPIRPIVTDTGIVVIGVSDSSPSTKTEIFYKDKITILVESNQLPHLRANLNSSIRLIQASFDSIKAVNI